MTSSTMISDASWCPNQRVAGWAVWIAGDLFKSQGFSGPIPKLCTGSNEAEVLAAAIGCGIAYRMFGATNILVQSDNQTVGVHIWGNLPDDVRQACQVRYRHVKGHTDRPGARFWANRWCDEQARKHMRSLRT